jgi:hypothetical protein
VWTAWAGKQVDEIEERRRKVGSPQAKAPPGVERGPEIGQAEGESSES